MIFLFRRAFFLTLLSLFGFFGVLFFSKKESLFENLIILISFGLTPLYAFFSTYLLYKDSKKGLSSSLLKIFSNSFFTLTLGGFFSILSIFVFFNCFADRNIIFLIKENIIKRWFEQNKEQMIFSFGLKAYNEKISTINQAPLFGFWAFIMGFLFCLAYYFLLSVLLAFFFRKK